MTSGMMVKLTVKIMQCLTRSELKDLDMLHIGWLQKIMLLLLMTMVILPTYTTWAECIGCPEDCSKVLVAPARVITIKEPEVVVVKPDAVKVSAIVEDDETGMSSDVRCKVESEGETDIITCGW